MTSHRFIINRRDAILSYRKNINTIHFYIIFIYKYIYRSWRVTEKRIIIFKIVRGSLLVFFKVNNWSNRKSIIIVL